jgi:drug/metabolite transporter (DMT)-like permease
LPRRRCQSSASAIWPAVWPWGYLPALASAFIWASDSPLTQRVAHLATAAIGLFGLRSGALSLVCPALREPPVSPASRDLLLIAATGLGPPAAAFLRWGCLLQTADSRRIGVLSVGTPQGSTPLQLQVSVRTLTTRLWGAAALIVGVAAGGAAVR